MDRPPPTSPLFPSTPLSRSVWESTHPAVGSSPRPARTRSRPRNRPASRSGRPRRDQRTKNAYTASCGGKSTGRARHRSEEHTSELQSLAYLVCRLLLEKKKG